MPDATPELTADQLAAHDLLSELRTRIASRPLPYQHGVEARALESLHELFALTRKAMKDHPGCEAFARRATNMLNVDLRPVTAKWHRAHQAGLLDSRDGANEFRSDLMRLQEKLSGYCLELQQMAYGHSEPDDDAAAVLDHGEIERCFKPTPFGLSGAAAAGVECAECINRDEAAAIAARRKANGIEKAAGYDAVGLALSGGGIRSATFCLGVLQVLEDRGIMRDVDYLSTVSGGGYTGALLTSWVGPAGGFEEVGNPHGPDTGAVRHLRRNAKYLSAVDWNQRWQMATATLAGLLLNWTAPLCALAVLALIGNAAAGWFPPGAWLAAASASAAVAAVLMLAYGVALRLSWGVRETGTALAVGTALSLGAVGAAALEWGYREAREARSAHWSLPAAIGLLIAFPVAVRFLPLFRTPRGRRAALQATLVAAGATVPTAGILGYYGLRMLGSEFPVMLIILAGATGAFAIFGLNVNLTGPHKLYRDRLSHTFIRPAAHGPPRLDSINPSASAPYHLINATVNLPSSTSDVLRDRRGDFFLLSKHWSGSVAVGYARTELWSANGGRFDLATAIAISGAAASPHMGLGSAPSLSALMTLLNIRLGFWVARPERRTLGAPGFSCLLREMTGAFMSEDRTWLNLSDGGHIENMGVYELLRRRCKFIVCIDGEADPTSMFQGQLTLVRHAQIDFGIRIEPRFDDVRPDPRSRFSRSHLQFFRIHYPRDDQGRPAIGLMLYLKLSLTGNEAELLKRYRALHPEFPHQSTLDQLYDEEQFEAYRQLGVHVAEGAFSPALMSDDRHPSTVAGWFRQLAANMLEPALEPL